MNQEDPIQTNPETSVPGLEEENYDDYEYKLNVPESDEEEEVESDLLLIDTTHADMLKEKISKGSTKAAKMMIKIFTVCFNEKELKNNSINYQIKNAEAMNNVLETYFEELQGFFGKGSNKKNLKQLHLIYLKNIHGFLSTLENENLLTRTLSFIKGCYDQFKAFRTLNKKLVREVLSIWQRDPNLSVKFTAFKLIKHMFTQNENDVKDYLFKNMIKSMMNDSSHLNWFNYDKSIFMRNCILEMIAVNPDLTYIIIYENLKQLSELYLKISKDKVS